MNSDCLETAGITFFSKDVSPEGTADKQKLGGKGASLVFMTKAGLPVPPGFILPTGICQSYFQQDRRWPDGLREQIRQAMARLELTTKRSLGQGQQPLLVSVRSGAAESMPGMMDTILNVGLNPSCLEAMGNRQSDWQNYLFLLMSYLTISTGCTQESVEKIVDDYCAEHELDSRTRLSVEQIRALTEYLTRHWLETTGSPWSDDPYESLFLAIETVFRSWENDRAVRYRQHHGLTHLAGTAITIQSMCPAEFSGVLFTAHPVNTEFPHMILEASKGFGEAVVRGTVTPERWVIHKHTGEILEHYFNGPIAGNSDQSLLTKLQIEELYHYGKGIEHIFGHPCDIEWSFSRDDGKLYLLQARQIKQTSSDETTDLETIREEEIQRVEELAAGKPTIWSQFNLSEILPEPTPMTWDIVRHFMSGKGGFGQMYRDLGFSPDPSLDEVGIYDLIAGRPYCNLNREPRMQSRYLPFEHPFELIKKNPNMALYPVAKLNPRKASWGFWMRLPVLFVQLLWSASKLKKMNRNFARRFREEIVPPFIAETQDALKIDMEKLDPASLLVQLDHWRKRTLFDFARDSLKPTALAANAMGQLERIITQVLHAKSSASDRPSPVPEANHFEEARRFIRELCMGITNDDGSDLAHAMQRLSAGDMTQEQFLLNFGHRGPNEMELSQPRWVEQPMRVTLEARQVSKQNGHKIDPKTLLSEWCMAQGLTSQQQQMLQVELNNLHTFVALRESAKHHFMRGYFLIRRYLLELDRRFQLKGGIFFLTTKELPELVKGKDFKEIIEQRKRERRLLLKLSMPQILFSDDLQAIGKETQHDIASSVVGIPLSAGIVEGTALVLDAIPEILPTEENYILVCPTTDPAWTPLFFQARGLIMETGGMLSHGAIVAREFGLPAIAGIPNVHKRLRTGQRVQMNGATGEVNIVA